MPKHLPGSPNIVVENKPGAATMLAANTVYNTEPKDGTVFANFNPQLLLSQAIKAEGVEFDAAKFNWLGAGTKEPVICVVRSDRGVDTIQQAMGGKELILPTTGPGSPPHDTPSVLNATLGTRFKLIGGYGGSAEQTLAVENGEADGKCGILDTGTLAWLDRGFAKVLIIMGSQTPDHPHLKGVPAAETLAKNDDDRALLRAVNAPSVILRSFFAPPGVPADRVAALQQAVSRAFEDPEFKAEAIQAKFSLDPSTGSEVAKIVDEVLGTPAPVLTRLKQILGT
jgi:tripartite-type tricarboxylate transporter receptor subunit TctC